MIIQRVLAALAATVAVTTAAHAGVLDKQHQLNRFSWWDNRDWDWYKSRIPFFESPDPDIDATYYYRWELTTKHMTYGSPATGYTYSEFFNRPAWSGAYGSISCPGAQQLYELRWLKDRRVTDDFANYWFHTPGAQPRGYSNWIGDAFWANYLVNGDRAYVVGHLPDMEAQYQGWLREHWDPAHRMFSWSSMHDGMEYSISGRQTQRPFDGADGYRPTLNCYLYGDLMAMARTAELAGNQGKAKDYRIRASELKSRVMAELWDPRRRFFLHQFRNDEVSEDGKYRIKAGTRIYDDGRYAGDSHGRELTGYTPWYFHLPDKGKGYEAGWSKLVSRDGFLAPYGLCFTERHDPLFMIAQSGCTWSGNNWPYADSVVLTAMANVLNDYPQKVITKADYLTVLKAYTAGCRKEGRPYLAEDSDPDTGRWVQDVPHMSDDYFHSSYNDLIITGLAGLRPRADDRVEVHPLAPDTWRYFALDDVAYHGHTLSVLWDSDGSRYRKGKGLTLLVDGRVVARRATMGRLTARLGPVPASTPPDRPHDFAVNNDGGYYPRIAVSSSGEGNSVAANLVNGIFSYRADRPQDRWMSGTGAEEWAAVDFGTERPVEMVKLYLLDDGESSRVRAPGAFRLDYWTGAEWREIPGQQRTPEEPEGHRANTVVFPAIRTARIRVVFAPRAGMAVGASEIEAWGHAALPLPQPRGPQGDLAIGAAASASFTSQYDQVGEINDGKLSFGGQNRNRWTAYESPNSADWVQLDFGKTVTVGRSEIYLWADGGGVKAAKAYVLEYWTGDAWAPCRETSRVPAVPTPGVANTVTFEPVRTQRLRVIFTHPLPSFAGATEWMVWER